MKILIISDAWLPQVNGVVRTYEHLQTELLAMRHDVRVMGPQDFFVRLPMPFYKEIELVPGPYGRMKYLIDTYNADHLHIATEGPLGWAARRYCLKHNRPFTTSYHTQFPDYIYMRLEKFSRRLAAFVRQKALDMIRHFHAPSHNMMVATRSLQEQLRAWEFKNPFHDLTRGVDLSLFYPGEKNLFTEMQGPIALFVGRVAVEKNIEAFLEMDWPGSKVVVGHGPSFDELKKKYKNVHFAGKKTDKELADHYRSADIFVFPSKTDTFGIVLIEAMACGLPIAGYPVTGPVDIVTEKALGAVDEDLALAAQTALNAPEDSAYRHRYAQNHYSWRRAAEQFLDAI